MTKKPFNQLNIMLAEDNLINQLLVEEVLLEWGVSLQIANNGREAVNMANKKKFDIIFMDLQMPVMDGFEAAKAIKSTIECSLNSDTPIFAMSADMFDETAEIAMANGMKGLLTKPVDIEKFRAILSEYSTS